MTEPRGSDRGHGATDRADGPAGSEAGPGQLPPHDHAARRGNGPGVVEGLEGPGPLAVTIRLEQPGDEDAIRAVELAAFDGPDEAGIVDQVRMEGPAGWRSLVAVDSGGRIVGHVLLTPCPVTHDGRQVGMVLALGPIAVLPEVQFRGVGTTLVAAALGLAVARATPAVVLLGHPSYYPRFGFEPARGLGLEAPAAWPDDAWLARRLPAWTPSLRGVVRYPEAFGSL